MECEISRGFGIEMLEEGQPLVVRVARRGLAEDLAVEIGEGGSETIHAITDGCGHVPQRRSGAEAVNQ